MADVKFSEFPEAEVPLDGTEYVVGLQQRSTESGESNVKMTVDDIATYVLSQDSNTGGGGSVSGPVSSTDNAAALWDGTGGDTLKGSTLVVGASDATIGGNAIYRAGGTDVPVADGGTGVSSLTAYAVICGGTTGTGAVQSIAGVGTSGQVLTSNGAGALPTFQTAAGGSLTNWTEAVNTSAPNATVPVTSFTATNAATNVDAAFLPKGTGATLNQIPDNTTTGGNKRGAEAVDWQRSRSNAAQVASGTDSVIGGGQDNSSTGLRSTVAGGFSNDATNSYAFIGGGESNTASNTHSTVSGGASNTSSGLWSTVGGGSSNQATDTNATVAGGSSNLASGTGAYVPGGISNRADGTYTGAMGANASARSLYGNIAHASGQFATFGDAQESRFVLRSDTTTATPEALTADNNSAGTTNQVVLPNNSAYAFRGHLVVRENATGDAKAIEFKGAIKRGANAAATALVGTPTQADLGADAGAAAWTLAITANTTHGALRLEVTGEASRTLRWVAMIETAEVVN